MPYLQMFMYIFIQRVHARAKRSHLILFSGGSGGKGSKRVTVGRYGHPGQNCAIFYLLKTSVLKNAMNVVIYTS